ncbi:MAG: KEOPS complex subunit Pcc1 [Candidatus Bathyarchaeota archaeon]|nr:KEOPS complex subunit Pcc1 [Candidatus Bathyarchaeum sp.]
MNAQAVVRLNFSSETQLHVVLQALKPETETSSTSRSKVGMTAEGQSLVLDFSAKDTSALRAAMNSYLRLIGVAINLHNLTE